MCILHWHESQQSHRLMARQKQKRLPPMVQQVANNIDCSLQIYQNQQMGPKRSIHYCTCCLDWLHWHLVVVKHR